MEPRRFSWPKLAKKKTSPPSLYFKMILHPVSVFLRNYFFLLTASGEKLFRKKTLQTTHGRFKISQMRRFTFHSTSLRYSDRHVIYILTAIGSRSDPEFAVRILLFSLVFPRFGQLHPTSSLMVLTKFCGPQSGVKVLMVPPFHRRHMSRVVSSRPLRLPQGQ